MSKETTFEIATHNLLTVVGTAEVLVPDAVRLIRDNEVVASADALYDFSGVPARYHQNLVALIPLPQTLLLPIAPNETV